jgi:hypothetical protein
MKATPVVTERKRFRSGFIEIVVWAVPHPVPPCQHRFKYRLAYVIDGCRVLGYDNERGKGDHCHRHGVEHDYCFIDIPTLLADFQRDLENLS